MTFLSRAAIIPTLAIFDIITLALPPVTKEKAVWGIITMHARGAVVHARARASAPECAPVCKTKTLAKPINKGYLPH